MRIRYLASSAKEAFYPEHPVDPDEGAPSSCQDGRIPASDRKWTTAQCRLFLDIQVLLTRHSPSWVVVMGGLQPPGGHDQVDLPQ